MFVCHDSFISNNQCIWGMGFKLLDMGTILGIVHPDLYKITHFQCKYLLAESMKTKHCSFIATNQKCC